VIYYFRQIIDLSLDNIGLFPTSVRTNPTVITQIAFDSPLSSTDYDNLVQAMLDQGYEVATASSSGFRTITSADSPYTVQDTDQTIRADASGGDVDVLLPSVASSPTRVIVILASDVTNDVRIIPDGSDTIDEMSPLPISIRGQSFRIQAPDTGSDWAIT